MMGHKQLMAKKYRYLSVAEGNEDFEHKKAGGRKRGIYQGKDKVPKEKKNDGALKKRKRKRERVRTS
jgi:hypothetical protein